MNNVFFEQGTKEENEVKIKIYKLWSKKTAFEIS